MPHPITALLTRRTLLRATAGALGLAGATILAACGGTTPTPQASAPSTSTLPVPASPPANTSPVAQATTALASTAAAPTAATTASTEPSPASPASTPPSAPGVVPSAAPGTAAFPPFDGIPQGRTPEGFFTLGAPNAPVTLIDYSDFL